MKPLTSNPTESEYGRTRAYFARKIQPSKKHLIDEYLPANLYATATRKEIAEQRIKLVQALREN